MSLERYVEDVDLADGLLHSTLFRPPYAQITPSQARHLGRRFKLVMWDVLSRDYSNKVSRQGCLRNVVNYIDAGSIVVFHDSRKSFRNMSYALPKTLEYIERRGWRCDVLNP